jgi:predicted acylesterase/phospholipase RssA
MIKNIVIGSGAHDIFSFIGMIDKLIEKEYIKVENIKEVYGVSAGAMIGLVIAANSNWDEWKAYTLIKPWDKYWEEQTTKGLLNIYNNKGLLDYEVMVDALLPVLKSVGLKRDITFKELYEHSGKKFNVYAFNINKWTSECFNHEETPDLEVLKGVYMSASFPFLFSPMYYNNSYYIDGGLHIDCPIDQCLKKCKSSETICIRKLSPVRPLNIEMKEGSSIMAYISLFIKKLVANGRLMDDLLFENTVLLRKNELILTELVAILSDEKMRRELYNNGKMISEKYIENKLKHSVDEFS